jgi:hypothetical protein
LVQQALEAQVAEAQTVEVQLLLQLQLLAVVVVGQILVLLLNLEVLEVALQNHLPTLMERPELPAKVLLGGMDITDLGQPPLEVVVAGLAQ